jgi:hypothetical protein
MVIRQRCCILRAAVSPLAGVKGLPSDTSLTTPAALNY